MAARAPGGTLRGMAFDPDAYLAEQPATPAFDPDAYLAEQPAEDAASPRLSEFVARVQQDPDLDDMQRETVARTAREAFAAGAVADTSLTERLRANALEAFTEGTVAGAGMRRDRLGQGEASRVQLIDRQREMIQREIDRRAGKLGDVLPEPSYVEYPDEFLTRRLQELGGRRDETEQARRRQRYVGLVEEAVRLGQYEGMPGAQGVLERGAAVVGAVAGGLPSPENVVALPAATGAGVLARAATAGVGAAAASVATEPVVQEARRAALQQGEGFDWGQAGLGALVAFAGGGLLEAAPALAGRITARIRAGREAAAAAGRAAELEAAEVNRIIAESLSEAAPEEQAAYRTALQRQIEAAAGSPGERAPEFRANRQEQVEEAFTGPQFAREVVVDARAAAADPAGALREQVAGRAEAADPTGYRSWWARTLEDAEIERQSPAGAARLRDELAAEQVAAAQDARLAERREPAPAGVLEMLQPGATPMDPRLLDPTVRDALGNRYMPPVEVDVGQAGRVRPAWEAPATAARELIFPGMEVANRRAVEVPAFPPAPAVVPRGATPPPAAPVVPAAVMAPKEKGLMTRREYALANREAQGLPPVAKEVERDAVELFGVGHEDFVADALARGLPVPREVLADYPGLKPKRLDAGIGALPAVGPDGVRRLRVADRREAARVLPAIAEALPPRGQSAPPLVIEFGEGGKAVLDGNREVIAAYAKRLPGAPKGTDAARLAARGITYGERTPTAFRNPTIESARRDLAAFEAREQGLPADLLQAETDAAQALKRASAEYTLNKGKRGDDARRKAWQAASRAHTEAQKALLAVEFKQTEAWRAVREAMGDPRATAEQARAWLQARVRQTELMGVTSPDFYTGKLTTQDVSALEKLRRGMVRLVSDSTDASKLGIMSPGMRKLDEAMKRFAPSFYLPNALKDVLRMGEQEVRGILSKGGSMQGDLRAAIRRLKDPGLIRLEMNSVQAYLTGRAPLTALNPGVRGEALRVRTFIDSLSDRAIRDGVVSGEMAQTFADNLGKYLRRSYRIHADPDYVPAPAVTKAAIDAVERAGMSRPEAAQLVNDLLDKNRKDEAARFLVGAGKLGGKDVSSLIRRKDLLPEVRALLGEIEDPLENIGQTIPRLARLIENTEAQRRVRDLGLKLGVFRDLSARPLADTEVGQWVPLVAEGSKTHDALAGLHTTPEVRTAFAKLANSGKVDGVRGLIWDAWRTVTAVSKVSKTVLNPDSYAPNLIGGIVMGAANGNFRVDRLGRGLMLGLEEAGALRALQDRGLMAANRQQLQEEVARLTALGLRGEGLSAADLVQTIDRSLISRLGKVSRMGAERIGGERGAAVADVLGEVSKVPFKIYGGTDDLTKYVAWKSEVARYARAFPQMGRDELERRAAEVVLDTMPTYSRVPKVMKELSQLGLSPTFINFIYEVFRNTANAARIGARDLREGIATGNRGLVRAGAERLVALTAVVGLSSGVGFSKWSREENGITDEKDEAVRFLEAPWNRNAALVYNSAVGADGKVQFSNKSYLLPHAILFEAATEAGRAQTASDQIDVFLRAFGGQFLGIENSVVLNAAISAVRGVDQEGRRVINRESLTVGRDRLAYFYDQALDPVVRAKIERLRLAASGQASETGRTYSRQEELKRALGMRAQTLDANVAADWKARTLARRMQDATALYRAQLKRNLSPAELAAAYERSEQSRQRVFAEMQKLGASARALNVSEDRVIEAMRKAEIPADIILGVVDGTGYVPGEKEGRETAAEILARLRAMPVEERAAELRRQLLADRNFGGRLMQQVREESKGLGARDKLVRSLGIGDGGRARYIKSMIDALPTNADKRAYLIDLSRKGILTETVLEQIAARPTK